MDAVAQENLNSLLESEFAAVQDYLVTVPRTDDAPLAELLRECGNVHIHNCERLKRTIKELGGIPCKRANLVSGLIVSPSAGDRALVVRLEQGENKRLRKYESLISMQGAHIKVLKEELIPKQKEIHSILNFLATERSRAS